MVDLFVHPDVPDYFLTASEVTSAASARSFVSEYEQAKVITFPNLKADIDHRFWGELDTDNNRALKKFSAMVDVGDYNDVGQHRRNLLANGVDERTAAALCDQFRTIYDTLLPVYRSVFGDYVFERQKVTWRLNTIMNENMHLDTYKEENHQHFARMFVNLDSQPRIWQTSWRIEDVLRRQGGQFSPTAIDGKSLGEIWAAINFTTFGKSSSQWWDDQPRHVAYFAPGDIWIVDSRQVAHQIFYGRRALSIDFGLAREGMLDPSRHYLAIAEHFRDEVMTRVEA